jgi:hypothetical protein
LYEQKYAPETNAWFELIEVQVLGSLRAPQGYFFP